MSEEKSFVSKLSFKLVKKLKRYIDVLEEANSIVLLLLIDELKEATVYKMSKELSKRTGGEIYLYPQSVNLRFESFLKAKLVDFREEEGEKPTRYYFLIEDGKKVVEALKKFLKDLEATP